MNKSLKTYIERPNSVVTGKRTEPLYVLRDFPVFFGCVDTPREEDLVADMHWEIDPDSGVVQLSRLVPLDILYMTQHVDGTGSLWQKYYSDFAKYIVTANCANILEIGGGAGQLAKLSTTMNDLLRWTVIEPNPIIEETSQISVIHGFFDSNLKVATHIDCIVMSQVLEHLYEPKELIRQMHDFLPVGGKVIVAYPQIKAWLQRKFTNALNFEHTILVDDFVKYLFESCGFRVTREEIYIDHSTFYTFEKTNLHRAVSIPSSRYQDYKRTFLEFISYHENLVNDLNSKIQNSSEPVFLFGAHIFATYLFAFGLSRNIQGILDNSKLKQERRFYGTDFIVRSPQILKGLGRVNVILKAGLHNEEIKRDILENINDQAVYW